VKRNSSSGKTEETAAQATQSEHDTYTTKTDRCSRRFGRRFSSGASRRLHAIFFFNAGSDRRLRTSLSRGYCWGLDLHCNFESLAWHVLIVHSAFYVYYYYF